MDILEQYNKEKLASIPVVSGHAAMPDESVVKMDGQMYRSRAILGELQAPKMIAWVLRHSGGILKTERQAAYVLLILACFVGLTAVFLLIKGIRGPYTQRGPGLTPKELGEYKKIQPF